MTSLLDGLDMGGVEVSTSKDSLSTGGFTWETGAYDTEIEVAYLDKNQWGGKTVNYVFKDLAEGKTLKITDMYANENNETFNEYNGKKSLRVGYRRLVEMAMLACDMEIAEALLESKITEKIVELYDFDAGGVVEVPRMVLTEFVGKRITLGITKNITNKKAKDDEGKWKTTNEEKISNSIEKLFRFNDKATMSEVEVAKANSGDVDPTFFEKWREDRGDKEINKFKETKGGGSSSNGSRKKTADIFK